MSPPGENPVREYQREHLILLVGGNPLPNYVAGMLLARDGGTVHLVHTKRTLDKGGTFQIAAQLRKAFERDRPTLKTIPYETDETDGNEIYKTTNEILDQVPSDEGVGLNYTGGTKPMVRHSARALADRVQEFPDPVYSYLDARTLKMVIEQPHGSPVCKFVREAVQPGLVKLLNLHGYKIDEPRQTPRAFEVCDVLRRLCVTEPGLAAWRKYLKDSQGKRMPDAKESKELGQVSEKLGALDPSKTGNLRAIARQLGYKEWKSATVFFTGKWLEEYTLEKLRLAADDLGNIDCGIEMKARKPGSEDLVMELDLAAMRGYQLFAISCQATTNADSAQEHFFEIYVRARQVGGDEARFALVCLLGSNDARHLQNKLETTWDVEGKLKVFGANDLAELDTHFKNWLNHANSA